MGARSVCSAPKVNVDSEAPWERGASAPLRRIMRIAKPPWKRGASAPRSYDNAASQCLFFSGEIIKAGVIYIHYKL